MDNLCINGNPLNLEDLVAVSRQGRPVEVGEKALQRIVQARALIDRWVSEEKRVYGVTTGFGALSDVAISAKDAKRLQRNILLSHAAGVGDPLPEEVVRGAILLRVNDISLGHSGVRPETVAHLLALLNRGVCPVVPSQGSVGASGDLAPLAHMALVLIGEGEAFYNGRRISGKRALKHCGLTPLVLAPGEGLALVNGTQVMTAIGALAVWDAISLAKHTDIAAAMSLEVLMGSRTEFDQRIHQLRPHQGQIESADNMLRITQNSEIISSHEDCCRVQDAYTLRCSPQVHGASRSVLAYVRQAIEIEMNAATGNPLIFPETGEFLVGGNFHGQPVAMAMDALTIAMAELANVSERRIERLVNPQLSGLPAFLVSNGGLHSGMMIAQYTAAALVSENKVLAHPACVDSIPTSANKEDHVSMGAHAARKCRQVIQNAKTVIAIELLCGAQAMDLFTNVKPGEGTLAAYNTVRAEVPHLEEDRIIAKDIDKIVSAIRSEKFVSQVEKITGVLY